METRDRIKDAGAQMFRRNGYTGTGVKQVAAAAGAQLGSLYHFFPGGKEQLAEEVIRTAGPLYGDLVYAILDPYQDLETAITEAFALAAQDLAASDYADACPIATIALEVASTNDHLRRATADVFTDWISRGAVLFARHGLGEPAARRLATAMIAALEGAFVLARALRDPEPLHAAGASVATAVRQALDQAAESPYQLSGSAAGAGRPHSMRKRLVCERATPQADRRSSSGTRLPCLARHGTARDRKTDYRGYQPVSAAHVQPEHPVGAARPWPSVENRRLHRPSQRPDAVRYVRGSPDTAAPVQDGTRRAKTKRPASQESTASGPFSQVVAGVGFEPT